DNEDGDHVCELTSMIGRALLTVLEAIQRAGELRPDSKYKDLGLVITYLLEFALDLPQYGLEGSCMAWRPEAVNYFKEAGLDAPTIKGTDNDPWGWKERMKNYATDRHVNKKLGGQQYDITKFTRAERAAAAFTGKDPLAHLSAKDLRNNLLDIL
ncbi:hypothetical protein BU23DRAFT_451375, partial [Bimuria novae-zelandiae CBS 107.79]